MFGSIDDAIAIIRDLAEREMIKDRSERAKGQLEAYLSVIRELSQARDLIKATYQEKYNEIEQELMEMRP